MKIMQFLSHIHSHATCFFPPVEHKKSYFNLMIALFDELCTIIEQNWSNTELNWADSE